MRESNEGPMKEAKKMSEKSFMHGWKYIKILCRSEDDCYPSFNKCIDCSLKEHKN